MTIGLELKEKTWVTLSCDMGYAKHHHPIWVSGSNQWSIYPCSHWAHAQGPPRIHEVKGPSK